MIDYTSAFSRLKKWIQKRASVWPHRSELWLIGKFFLQNIPTEMAIRIAANHTPWRNSRSETVIKYLCNFKLPQIHLDLDNSSFTTSVFLIPPKTHNMSSLFLRWINRNYWVSASDRQVQLKKRIRELLSVEFWNITLFLPPIYCQIKSNHIKYIFATEK